MAASFARNMNLANFTCKFGERVMLDLFDEVVMPAFEDGYIRTFSDASYFLIDVGLHRWSKDGLITEMAIAGRIVKNTVLARDQIFKDGKIVKDHAELASAPTAVFVLLLSNHKLLYVRENVGAPSLNTFASTISQFLSQSFRKWIRGVYDSKNHGGRNTTWADLMKEFPPPVLEVTPMATESSVSAYVEKFSVVNAVEIQLIETNHELDNLPIFGEMREIKDKIQADDISLKTHKKGKVGLSKDGVKKLVATPAAEGNSKIVIRGTGIGGDRLVAKNDSFNVAIPVPNMPQEVGPAAGTLLKKLQDQMALGIINLKAGGKVAMDKIAAIAGRREWS
jgi:hypothetical protein